MAGDNRHVTENFLRLNFSPKPGITPGTNDSILMDCDQITARYYVLIAGVSSTGKRLPSQNQLSDSVTLPTVSTGSITSITATTATGSGNVSADGGATVTDRGIQWSIYSNFSVIAGSASGGSGTGAFTAPMTGLSCGTTYYVRAFAANSAGTAYGGSATVTPTSLNFASVTIYNWISTSCGTFYITSEATAKQAYLNWINPACTKNNPSLSGYVIRIETLSVGKSFYKLTVPCVVENLTGWFMITSGYVIQVSSGTVTTVISYPW